MATGPLIPEPNLKTDQRLTERADFIGDAGRSGREVQGADPDDNFETLLHRRVEVVKKDDKREAGTGLKPGAEVLVRSAELRQGSADQTPLTPAELAEQNRRHALKEAERHGFWQGPAALVGLSVAGAGPTGLSSTVSRNQRSRAENEAGRAGQEITPGEARVDPRLLEGLKASGLAQPVSGLADPRLAGPVPQLGDDWHQSPVAGGVCYLWEGGVAHQKLEWSEGRVVLESAAGTMIQVLERNNGQISARRGQREVPSSRRFKVGD